MKVTCRDGGWAVRAEPSLLLSAHFNQEQLFASSTEMFWTFAVRNHPFCLGMVKTGPWEWRICGNEGLKWLPTLNAPGQGWHPHWWLWWRGGVGVLGHWAAHGGSPAWLTDPFWGSHFHPACKMGLVMLQLHLPRALRGLFPSYKCKARSK